MKDLDAVRTIVKLIEDKSNISESLIRCHNFIAQFVPADEFDKETQGDLYDLYQVVKAIKLLENELCPPENSRISELEELLIKKEDRIRDLERQVRKSA